MKMKHANCKRNSESISFFLKFTKYVFTLFHYLLQIDKKKETDAKIQIIIEKGKINIKIYNSLN